MQNFKNHSTQSTNPTEAMSYIDFLENFTQTDSSPFDEFMGYDTNGNSMPKSSCERLWISIRAICTPPMNTEKPSMSWGDTTRRLRYGAH